jgi:hypothetical protein
LFDFVIAVEEFPPQHLRQSPPDGGLAGAHRADQEDAGD